MAGHVGQINAAVTALNSTSSSTVSSLALTAALYRYNAAALALQQATDFTNTAERLMSDVASQTGSALHALHALQAMLSSTATTAWILC